MAFIPEIDGTSSNPYTPPQPPKPAVVTKKPAAPKPAVVTNSKGNYVKPAATPAMPDIGAYLNQDTGYQQQLREFAKALNDFNADVLRRRGSLDTQYGLSTKALGDQKLLDLDALKQDYGARGLLQSGLYGKAIGDYNTEWNQRMTDLDRQQQDALSSLTQEQNQFSTANQLKEQAAKEAAIRRRAEQYGV